MINKSFRMMGPGRKTGLAAALALIAGLVLTACPGSGDGHWLDLPILPNINEAVIGRASVTGTGITLPGSSDTIAEQTEDYGEWSVSNGKLSFTLGTVDESSLQTVGDVFQSKASDWFGKVDGDYSGKISPQSALDSVKCVYIEKFSSGGTSIIRKKTEADAEFDNYSQIIYLYVGGDITISRDPKEWKEGGETTYFKTVSLPLKKGWNLVQIDSQHARNYWTNRAIKIAEKDVPWAVQN